MACQPSDCVPGAAFEHAMGAGNGGNEIRGSAKFACIQKNSLLRTLEDTLPHSQIGWNTPSEVAFTCNPRRET